MYKFRKFARKHRAALATAVAIAASLILGTTAIAWQAARATHAEAQANANATQAQANSQEAKEKAQEATTQRDEAQKHRDEAQRQRDEVKALNDKLAAKEQQLQGTLYAAHMNLAQRAWEEAAGSRVLELLEQHRPKPEEPDLRGFEWHYLNRLCHADQLLTLHQLLTLKKGSPAVFDSVAFTPDGKRLMGLTLGWVGTFAGVATKLESVLRVWDAQTGQELFTFTLKGGGRTVVFSPDARRLAGTSEIDRTVKVWDAQTGQELLSLPGGSGWVVFSPDGKHLASPFGGKVNVWDAETGQELPALKWHTDGVNSLSSVTFTPDGKRLATISGTWDDTKKADVAVQVKVWDAQTGQELLTLKGLTDVISEVTFSPDSKRLVTRPRSVGDNSAPGEVKMWDAQTGEELFGLKGQSDGYGKVAFSPDGKRLVATSGNSTTPRIHVWDAQTGQVLFIFQGHTSQVSGLTFSPDSKRLASGWGDRTLRIWDLQTGQEIRTLRGHISQPRSLAFSPDGKRLAITSEPEVKV